jgi:hypothetical protein
MGRRWRALRRMRVFAGPKRPSGSRGAGPRSISMASRCRGASAAVGTRTAPHLGGAGAALYPSGELRHGPLHLAEKFDLLSLRVKGSRGRTPHFLRSTARFLRRLARHFRVVAQLLGRPAPFLRVLTQSLGVPTGRFGFGSRGLRGFARPFRAGPALLRNPPSGLSLRCISHGYSGGSASGRRTALASFIRGRSSGSGRQSPGARCSQRTLKPSRARSACVMPRARRSDSTLISLHRTAILPRGLEPHRFWPPRRPRAEARALVEGSSTAGVGTRRPPGAVERHQFHAWPEGVVGARGMARLASALYALLTLFQEEGGKETGSGRGSPYAP